MYRENLINRSLPKYIIAVLISLYIGAVLFSILSLLIDDIVNNDCEKVLEIIFSGNYGLVYYGGLSGVVLSTCFFVKRKLISTSIYSILSFIIPLFHSISRIGCYFAGCCYGTHNEDLFQLPYYFNGTFTGEYCVPTQIYEALFEAIVMVMFFILYIVGVRRFNLLKMYLLIYAVFRFIIEFFRADDVRGIYFGFSFSQYISFFIILVLALKNIKVILGGSNNEYA